MLQGPQIVTVPEFDTPNRYWIVPFLDAYLNYYGAIGSYFNSSAGQYLVVGRGKPLGQGNSELSIPNQVFLTCAITAKVF